MVFDSYNGFDRKKNGFFGEFKNLTYIDTDLKIILLDYQNYQNAQA